MTNNYTEQVIALFNGDIELQDVSDELIQILLDRYPFSPYGHLINYLKAKSNSAPHTEQLLNKLAMYSPNRAWLQEVLRTQFSDLVFAEETPESAIPSEAKNQDLDRIIFEFDFQNNIVGEESVDDVALRDELESVQAEVHFIKEIPKATEPESAAPEVEESALENTTDSFTSWLKSLKTAESSPTEKEAPSEEKLRTKESKPVDSDKNTRKDDDLFGGIITETLAELLANQGQIEKAIKMYERLSLIFPQKSAFFAAKIEQLKSNIT